MAALEILASGYGTVEAPTVDPQGNLYFSDITGGGVRRITPEGKIELIVPKRKGVGGSTLHADGGIVVSGRDISHIRNGETRALFSPEDCAALGLTQVNSFNDIHADDLGRVIIGTVRVANNGERLPTNAMILVSAQHRGTILYQDFTSSNGMALDWERQRLYHCNSREREFIVSQKKGETQFEIVSRLATRDVDGTPDGCTLDEEGCVWAAFYRGNCVARFSSDGRLLQRIDVPAHLVTSVCFAGADGMDLIIVTADNTDKPEIGGCVFRTRVDVRGAKVGVATI